MAHALTSAPALSTPETHILSETEPVHGLEQSSSLSEEQLMIQYEIERTVREIRLQKWHRVALQFPDQMLPHSSRVYGALSRELSKTVARNKSNAKLTGDSPDERKDALSGDQEFQPVKLTILADTSYGACCVDEIAAEHLDADAVIHYGRACLSPTIRLPVLHVFTQRNLEEAAVIDVFTETFPDQSSRIVLTADIPYHAYVEEIGHKLHDIGYLHVFPAEIIHNPSSLIPNRTIPTEITKAEQLNDWHMFHIAEPPTSLLLTLSSMMRSIRIYSPQESDTNSASSVQAHQASTSVILRRRYALVTSMTTVSTWGILINTLSVKNYLDVLQKVKQQIAAAGKKSYLFVVGKLNSAKVANFAEIGGWVVIGCWESSLIDSKDFFKPILTPFELNMALASDDSRVWTGAWRSDFDGILNAIEANPLRENADGYEEQDAHHSPEVSSEEESEPPEFDLRTGRYVTRSRPMGIRNIPGPQSVESLVATSNALVKRANGDMIAVNGVASPAAEYLKEKRTWQGLGSDFNVGYEEVEQEGSLIEEGRTGVAGGYTVGDSSRV